MGLPCLEYSRQPTMSFNALVDMCTKLIPQFCLLFLCLNAKMHAVWMSWKRSLSCGDKVADVRSPEKPASIHIFTKESFLNRYHELKVGDPSRNVIEKILSCSKQPSKTRRVLRVKNPQETIEKFEKYRDMVRKKASVDEPKRHTRTMVDGNEVLCFYPTTMTCCTAGKSSKSVSTDLCGDYGCRACRIMESGFHTEHYRRNGIIQMNTYVNSAASPMCFDESIDTKPRGKKNENVKRAVIICRMIAGRIMSLVDDGDGCGEEGGYDSVRGKGFLPYAEYLMVRNPDAVLPCFLVVL